MQSVAITTDRLCLRQFGTDDLPSLRWILGDAEAMNFSDQGPLNATEQLTWLEGALA